MLGDYIDPNQPWLGETTSSAASASQPWWQGVVNVVTKVAGAVKAAQPAISSIKSQVDALKQKSSAITAASYGAYNYGTSTPPPSPVAKDNTGAIILGAGVAIAAAVLIYVAVDSGSEKKK